ncbi:MAG: phosphoribosylformylglycinamidine cyclo-ligase [Chloroflexi bacterium]|nr:phosphoribosylformylglycinamidine cyclo-ligase [Chloroflexota bacterium]
MSGEAYSNAGVDLDAIQKVKQVIQSKARATYSPQVLGGVGFFGSLYQLSGYKEPVLVSSTDGVGTKLKVASLVGRLDTLGEDLVNHCVNDILTCGARPLFFLDYIAVPKLEPQKVEALIEGIVKACKAVNCPLVGGETAQMPGVYAEDSFDLVGFIVGAVEKDQILDGSQIRAGDRLLGIPSNGLQTNGYSLVRRIFNLDQEPSSLHTYYPELRNTLGEALLKTHPCYSSALQPVLSLIKGMAHITGGGLLENLPRVLPHGLGARLYSGSWPVLPIFDIIQKQGQVSQEEMYQVFNMGLGMVLVCEPERLEDVIARVPQALQIGEVVRQNVGERVIIQ